MVELRFSRLVGATSLPEGIDPKVERERALKAARANLVVDTCSRPGSLIRAQVGSYCQAHRIGYIAAPDLKAEEQERIERLIVLLVERLDTLSNVVQVLIVVPEDHKREANLLRAVQKAAVAAGLLHPSDAGPWRCIERAPDGTWY